MIMKSFCNIVCIAVILIGSIIIYNSIQNKFQSKSNKNFLIYQNIGLLNSNFSTLPAISASFAQPVLEISLKKPKLEVDDVRNDREHIICALPLSKSPPLIWSTAQIEVKSMFSSCRITENLNLTDLEESRKQGM